jgi:cyanophycinase
VTHDEQAGRDAHLDPGPLVLVGGAEWTLDTGFDRDLVERYGRDVLVLPTAAAYEDPGRVVATATAYFARLGATVTGCMVLTRSDAQDTGLAEQVRAASFVYLAGGSPLHLRSVLKDSAVLRALTGAWHGGAVVAGSSAGAMVLSDPMVDPRGGALTVGLGLVRDLAVVPHYSGQVTAQLRRTLDLARDGIAVAAVPEATALLREPGGVWSVAGRGDVAVFVDGVEAGLAELAGRPVG